MEDLFIPYEQALTLKELGFDEPCLGYYDHDLGLFLLKYFNYNSTEAVSAPLYQQSFKFFREKYGLASVIHLKMSNNKRKIWFNICELDNRLVKSMYFKSYVKGMFKTYEEAELECLKELIKIVKENEKVI